MSIEHAEFDCKENDALVYIEPCYTGEAVFIGCEGNEGAHLTRADTKRLIRDLQQILLEQEA